MSKLRIAGLSGALVAAALVGGTLINAVAAAPAPGPVARTAIPAQPADPAGAPPAGQLDPAASRSCEVFRSAFARNLGVETSALNAAGKQAALTTVDEAVAAGDLTKAQGDRLKAKINAAPTDACLMFANWAKKIDAGVLGVIRDGMRAAAESLGLTPRELRDQMRAGATLKEIAAARNVPYATVTSATVAAVKADLDKAVAAHRITQAREDRILDRLEANLADGRFRAPKTPQTPTP